MEFSNIFRIFLGVRKCLFTLKIMNEDLEEKFHISSDDT